MPKTIQFQASSIMVNDLKELQQHLGASTLSDTIRRVVAREVALARAKKTAKELVIQGEDPNGETVTVVG